jgi:RNA polymerase sigma-70 factor (ECF subfamily)
MPGQLLDATEYKHWLTVAARYARRAGEAEDLLHDSLLAAAEARRADLSDSKTRAWFAGLIRNKAAMDARTAARRKRREAIVSQSRPQPTLANPRDDDAVLELVRSLPPATRAVATLALHGMTRPEIACALRLSDEALRQRLTTLRRKWVHVSRDAQDQAIERVQSRRRTIGQELALGTMRRALLTLVRDVDGIGTHDPDGHLLVFESRGHERRQQQ